MVDSISQIVVTLRCSGIKLVGGEKTLRSLRLLSYGFDSRPFADLAVINQS